MHSLHFKTFFETYFNYPYEKLKFYESVLVQQQVANAYHCSVADVECVFVLKKNYVEIQSNVRDDDEIPIFEFYEAKFFGFYRVFQSDFYIPFVAYINPRYVIPRIELEFNHQINNSIFDCIHMPLKKEKTVIFSKKIIDNLTVPVKTAIHSSGVMVLDEPLKKSEIYIDLYSSLLDIKNQGYQFTELLSMCFDASYEDMLYAYYNLRYYINNHMEHLFLHVNNMVYFDKEKFLSQTFKGIDIFCDFKYKTIEELDCLVKKYRKVEEMYTI